VIDRTKVSGSMPAFGCDESAAAGAVPAVAIAADITATRVRFLRLMNSSFGRIRLDASPAILKGR